jgi:hypothetical protein
MSNKPEPLLATALSSIKLGGDALSKLAEILHVMTEQVAEATPQQMAELADYAPKLLTTLKTTITDAGLAAIAAAALVLAVERQTETNTTLN